MKKTILFFIISLFLFNSCKKDDSNPVAPTTGTIQGKVTNTTGDSIVVGANVSTLPPTSSVTTNSNGEFEIDEVSPGNYSVNAIKGGYNDGSVSINVTAGKTTTANIQMDRIINHSPNIPYLIAPAYDTTNQQLSLSLSWSCSDQDGDALVYDVYLDKTNPPANKVSSNQTITNYSATNLDTSSVYYWKIVAKDVKGASTSSNLGKFTTTNNVIPKIGLVAYYPFNGNANDESGNGNNGTVNGATLTVDRFGLAGKAYSFNGSSNYINCGNPQNNSLDLGTNATLSTWVNFNSVGNGYQVLIGKDIGPGNCIDKWIMWYNAYSNNYITSFTIGGEGCSQGWLGSDKWTPNIGQWYHIAITKSGNQYTFFLNGNRNGYVATTVAIPDVNADLTMGMADGGNFLDGSLDDVRIYNRALSDEEIKQLYHEGGR